MATFTDVERGSFRFHMGVPDSETHATVIAATRALSGKSWQIDKGLEVLNESSKPRALAMLAHMESLHSAVFSLAKSAEFLSVGDIVRNQNARNEIVRLYDDAGRQLSRLLGDVTYIPWAARGGAGGGSSLQGTCGHG